MWRTTAAQRYSIFSNPGLLGRRTQQYSHLIRQPGASTNTGRLPPPKQTCNEAKMAYIVVFPHILLPLVPPAVDVSATKVIFCKPVGCGRGKKLLEHFFFNSFRVSLVCCFHGVAFIFSKVTEHYFFIARAAETVSRLLRSLSGLINGAIRAWRCWWWWCWEVVVVMVGNISGGGGGCCSISVGGVS